MKTPAIICCSSCSIGGRGVAGAFGSAGAEQRHTASDARSSVGSDALIGSCSAQSRSTVESLPSSALPPQQCDSAGCAGAAFLQQPQYPPAVSTSQWAQPAHTDAPLAVTSHGIG